jgi:hypothetical protein
LWGRAGERGAAVILETVVFERLSAPLSLTLSHRGRGNSSLKRSNLR